MLYNLNLTPQALNHPVEVNFDLFKDDSRAFICGFSKILKCLLQIIDKNVEIHETDIVTFLLN